MTNYQREEISFSDFCLKHNQNLTNHPDLTPEDIFNDDYYEDIQYLDFDYYLKGIKLIASEEKVTPEEIGCFIPTYQREFVQIFQYQDYFLVYGDNTELRNGSILYDVKNFKTYLNEHIEIFHKDNFKDEYFLDFVSEVETVIDYLTEMYLKSEDRQALFRIKLDQYLERKFQERGIKDYPRIKFSSDNVSEKIEEFFVV